MSQTVASLCDVRKLYIILRKTSDLTWPFVTFDVTWQWSRYTPWCWYSDRSICGKGIILNISICRALQTNAKRPKMPLTSILVRLWINNWVYGLHSIVYALNIVTCWRMAHETCGEPSTEYSSGQPQCSAHGQRLREHCPRFPCQGILQCWWSPYEMNDEKTGSLVHTLFIQGCPGSFTCLSTGHWVQGTL